MADVLGGAEKYSEYIYINIYIILGMMSKDTSRTSSQDTTVSLVVAKDSLMGKELQAPLHKAPVKTALHQAVTDGRIHQARLLSANVKNIDTKV